MCIRDSLGTVAFVLGARSALAIIETTALGYDKMERWPDFEIIGWLGAALYFINALAICCMPIGLIAMASQQNWLTFLSVPVVFIFFPLVFMSMLDNASPMVPYSRFIRSSVTHVKGAWIKFYVQAAIIFGLLIATHIGAALLYPSMGIVTAYLATLVTVALGVVYVRLMGRLAWVIDEKMTKRSNEETAPPEMAISK